MNESNFDIIDLNAMTPQEWDAYRKDSMRIGGSDIGTIIGLNKYQDAITLWATKSGLIENSFSASEATQGGHLDEAGILTRLEHWDGIQWHNNHRAGVKFREIVKPNVTYIPKAYPWMAINVDGIIKNDNEFPGFEGIAEAKKISRNVSMAYQGGVPPSYVAQGVLYMLGLDLPFARIALLEDGVKLNVRTFERSMIPVQRIEDEIMNIGERFYEAVVEGRKAANSVPKSEYRDVMIDLMAKYHDVLSITSMSMPVLKEIDSKPRSNSIVDESMDGIFMEYNVALADLAAASSREAELKNQITQYIITNGITTVESKRFRASYNKRFTFTKL